MYGLVNRAIEEMVCQHHGDAAWERIRAAAGVEDEVFLTNEAYDDAVTYRLVAAACSVLGAESEQVLEQFGRHWVLKTARESYGDLLRSAGSDVGTFLANLPNFHTRVKLLYPHLRPPVFQCDALGESSMELHYRSTREGLTSFVRGLLHGIGEMFGVQVRVEQTSSRAHGQDHDVFLVSWPPAR